VLVDLPKDVLQAATSFSWPPTMDLPVYLRDAAPTVAFKDMRRVIEQSVFTVRGADRRRKGKSGIGRGAKKQTNVTVSIGLAATNAPRTASTGRAPELSAWATAFIRPRRRISAPTAGPNQRY